MWRAHNACSGDQPCLMTCVYRNLRCIWGQTELRNVPASRSNGNSNCTSAAGTKAGHTSVCIVLHKTLMCNFGVSGCYQQCKSLYLAGEPLCGTMTKPSVYVPFLFSFRSQSNECGRNRECSDFGAWQASSGRRGVQTSWTPRRPIFYLEFWLHFGMRMESTTLRLSEAKMETLKRYAHPSSASHNGI